MQWWRRVADAAGTIAVDRAWLSGHPLPTHGDGTDKNDRGHVVAIGGSRAVPGGLLLAGEAALRAGAGKVQLATVESCAIGLGVAFPEAGVIALNEGADGEIDSGSMEALAEALDRCDSVVLGPAMISAERAGALLDVLIAGPAHRPLVLDAAAIHALSSRVATLSSYRGTLTITPNPDELASLLGCDASLVSAQPADCAREAAKRLNAIVVCKGGATFIASPEGRLLRYPGGGVGLATGGSGDVLAGIVAGLLARGSDPITAAAWGVWLHGEAGRKLAKSVSPIGFLARETLATIPGLMADERSPRD